MLTSVLVQVGSDPAILHAEVEREAREICEGMKDVKVIGVEVDHGAGAREARVLSPRLNKLC